MRELVIEASKEGKGRSFSASLLSYVLADNLWEGGATSTEVTRPVWWMLAGSDNELRPFVANLRLGRKAEVLGNSSYRRKGAEKYELLKSSGFQVAWQRLPLGSVVTIFEPELFRLDPGMVDPKGVSFVILPSSKWNTVMNPKAKAWLSNLPFTVPEEKVDNILPLAPLFVAYLDRRTRCPLIPDPRFYVQVLAAALQEGLATFTSNAHRNSYDYRRADDFGVHGFHGFYEYETKAAKLDSGVAFKSSHETLERFLAEQVTLYFNYLKDGK